MKICDIIGCVSLALLLSGCSPHPGAGVWVADKSNNSVESNGFVELDVMFEGRTDIFDRSSTEGAGQDRTAARRCFWHSIDASTIELTCVHAANTDIEEDYQLRVGSDNKVSELMQDGRVMGRYHRVIATD